MIDAATPVMSVHARDGEAFLHTDSHLAPPARIAVVRAVVEHLAPGTWSDTAVTDQGQQPTSTDLSRMIGTNTAETVAQLGIERPPASPVVPGRTVIVHDSQFELAADDLRPWFEQITFVHWEQLDDPETAALLRSADRIVLETVQNAVVGRFTSDLSARLGR